MDVRKTQNDALEPEDFENDNPAIFNSEHIKLLSDKLSFALNCIKNGTLNLNTSDENSQLSLTNINGKINLDVRIVTSCCKSCETQNNQKNKKNEIKVKDSGKSDSSKESKKNNLNLYAENNKNTVETVQQQQTQNSGWSKEITIIDEEEDKNDKSINNNNIKSKLTVHKDNVHEANLSTKNIKLCSEQRTAGCSKNLDQNLSQKETINKNSKSASNLNKSKNFSTTVFSNNQSNERKRKLKEILNSDDDILSTESSEDNESE